MNTTVSRQFILPSQPVTSQYGEKPRQQHRGLMNRLSSFCVGCCEAVFGVAGYLVSFAVAVVAVVVAVFMIPWLLMLPAIVTGGLVHLVEVAARWV